MFGVRKVNALLTQVTTSHTLARTVLPDSHPLIEIVEIGARSLSLRKPKKRRLAEQYRGAKKQGCTVRQRCWIGGLWWTASGRIYKVDEVSLDP